MCLIHRFVNLCIKELPRDLVRGQVPRGWGRTSGLRRVLRRIREDGSIRKEKKEEREEKTCNDTSQGKTRGRDPVKGDVMS